MPPRTWEAQPAQRGHTPLLVGLMGPAGGGKTYSALELATGMQEVVGGDIYGIDTEQNRMTAYADYFKFKHMPFRPPFGSADYLDALRWVAKQGTKTVIVDSMSHEHAGEGGYLDFHDRELNRLAGTEDQDKRDKRNMQAWIKPSDARQRLIQGILQLDLNFVFTFRAKERVKPDGAGKVREMGFMPVAGDDFLYELTVCALLMPAAMGVPTWKSAMPGEAMMIRPAKQFADLFDNYGLAKAPLSRAHGRGLAMWARGQSATADAPTGSAEPSEQRSARAPDPGWDHAAWATNFGETLGELKVLADFDAVYNDPSNKALLVALSEIDLEAAKRLRATATGKRKALRDKEQAMAKQDEF